ncbi:Hypothetical protein SCF082_LOCUS11658 [Durusdinium trenchii]|uniref:Uncharacterized protein n=1 Tax=Durusdinium trenchii TaxID=1381693 RepID=A0ABP0JF07_9DINO
MGWLETSIKLLTASAIVVGASAIADEDLCLGNCTGTIGVDYACTFYFRMNIFAGETGYYEVDGCEGTQPTLGMIAGVEYTFDQTDPTNWFHPLGFAYGPDGVYGDEPELEKGVVPPNGTACDELTPCQYPQYKLNGVELCDDPGNCADDDFGLDQYEGVYFSGGRDDWIAEGNFTVDVTITDDNTTELFYFCHIHNKMSGRIKVLEEDGSTQKDPVDYKAIPYDYHVISEFDEICGTHNVSQFQDGEGCPEMTFFCEDNLDSFHQCMLAIDCAMHVEMRVSGNSNPVVTFMHQMIAHHRNAVNMAKILLRFNPPQLKCGTAYDGRRLSTGSEHEFCNDGNTDGGTPAITLLWDIINTQNQQITFMRAWLDDNSEAPDDYCEAPEDFPWALVGGVVGAFAVSALSVGMLAFWRISALKAQIGQGKVIA